MSTTTSPQPTGVRRLLTAAASLEEPFTTTQLALRAWELAPMRYGLKGHELVHLSDNRVLADLFGHRGLIKRGLLVRVGPKVKGEDGLYRLTDLARRELERPGVGPVIGGRVPAAVGAALVGLLQHRAFSRWKQRRESPVAEARSFVELADAQFDRARQAGGVLDVAAAYLVDGVLRGNDGHGGEMDLTAEDVADLQQARRELAAFVERHGKRGTG